MAQMPALMQYVSSLTHVSQSILTAAKYQKQLMYLQCSLDWKSTSVDMIKTEVILRSLNLNIKIAITIWLAIIIWPGPQMPKI